MKVISATDSGKKSNFLLTIIFLSVYISFQLFDAISFLEIQDHCLHVVGSVSVILDHEQKTI